MAVETAAPTVEGGVKQFRRGRSSLERFWPRFRSWWSMTSGDTMQRINLYQFYVFGAAIQALEQFDIKSNNIEALFDAVSAIVNLSRQGGITLKFAEQSLSELSKSADDLISEYLEDEPKPARILSKFNVAKGRIRKFETLFETELSRTAETYSVSRKGIYSTSELVDRADEALPDDLRSALPQLASADLRAAGRCLAFDLPTASAFHLLRAAEEVIKRYYEALKGEKWGDNHKDSQRNWGQYIRYLGEANAKPTITSALTQIKELYRNPIVHPEAQLDSSEALNLFNLTVGVLTLMMREVLILDTQVRT